MKFKNYLLDRLYLILFYCILMSFICGVVYFDSKSRMANSNILYLLLVSTILFAVYMGLEFLVKKKYYDRLVKLLENKSIDWVYNLPPPSDFEQQINNAFLSKLYNQANEEIEKFIKKGKEDLEFITTWVHQIKTPIAASRLVIENSLNSPSEETLNSIEEEIDRIEDYVQKALYYSRLNDFSKDYIIGSINIETLIKESIKKCSKSFINKNIKVVMNDLGHEVSTDKKWASFIIDQVISNALKYTNRGGTIRIYMETLENEKLLHIEDTGIGIRQEDIGRVFDKSFTGYNGREVYNSTGMGLYLSQKLAKKLGHYLTISSKFKEGTKVTLHFPKWIDYREIL